MDRALLLDVVVANGLPVVKLLAAEDEPLLLGRDAVTVFPDNVLMKIWLLPPRRESRRSGTARLLSLTPQCSASAPTRRACSSDGLSCDWYAPALAQTSATRRKCLAMILYEGATR